MRAIFIFCLICIANYNWCQSFVMDKNGLVTDKRFQQLIKERNYELVGTFCAVEPVPEATLAKYRKGEKWGIINLNGKELTPPIYSQIGFLLFMQQAPHLLMVSRYGNYGFINLQGKEQIPPHFKSGGYYISNNALVVFNDNYKELFGLIDTNGKVLVPFHYNRIFPLKGGTAIADSMGVFSLMDSTGAITKLPRYSSVTSNYPMGKEGTVIVKQNGKYGYLNAMAKEIIPPSFDEAIPFSEGLGRIRKDSLWYFTNREGKMLPGTFQDARDFREGVAAVKQKGKWGFIDSLGNLVIPFQYDEYRQPYRHADGSMKYEFGDSDSSLLFHSDRTIVYQNGKWGLINKQGKYIAPPIYERLFGTDARYYSFFKDIPPYSGFISREGKVLLITNYTEDPIEMNENRLRFVADKKFGYVDSIGRKIIPARYEEATPFKNGLAAVRMGKKWGVIDSAGKTIVPFSYDKIALEVNEIVATINDKPLPVKGTGQVTASPLYEIEMPVKGKKSVFRKDGTLLFEQAFTSIRYSGDGLYEAEWDGNFGWADSYGNISVSKPSGGGRF